jgi:transcription initiation factor IIE alpha subunit
MQHAAGFTDEEVARNVGMNPKSVRRLLKRVGVDVAQEVVVSKREGRNNGNE